MVIRLLTNIPSMTMVTEWGAVSIATYVAVLPKNALVRPGNIITLNAVEWIERVEAIMSYETDCADYVIHGDPERENADYELWADYDRLDGLREEMAYHADDEDCGDYDAHAAYCARLERDAYNDRAGCADVPF
jgi:hypothetical protein